MNWEEKEIQRIAALSNEDLYDEAICCQIPDDYDGMMSRRGDWIAKETLKEFESRLRLSGFFDMPLEFYLGELGDTFSIACHEDGIQCYSERMNRIFIGKTALEAAKAAYKWKTQ